MPDPTATAPNDDLLTPSLQDRPSPRTGALPWRLSSQFPVAFFGGPLAIGVIAYLNGRRLSLSPGRQRAILIATGVAFVVALGLIVSLLGAKGLARTAARRVGQAAGVVLYLVVAWIQKPADRRHAFFNGEYASLWKPGFLAVAGSALVSIAVAIVVATIVVALR